ncbi:helix-turn-helix transcriptional regulator [Leucobacter sp. UT-8R-CII-1-4]|uniref:helix-turn-helix domain-containing protein n=1 Tax=Leucobacter sp. UT-8R-CII-1-4 TaxID=3040075 RepID=UPI0024A9FC8D|nr:helix-turn-helix transcriptional regulator [Leucobacter sp. UT-8R-CII-1-4]MDI6023584.1 helix-turn-helix transcriptional regulator [Leucobacter sp. UT-8R-CII-1-4]
MATEESADSWEAFVRELRLRLQRARAATGLSQEKIAHAAGISTFTYLKLEKGESNPGTAANPRLKTLVALAEILGVNTRDLLSDDSPRVADGKP